MARALQTMVLAQDQVVETTFSSIEEWLGNNTQDYYDMLAATGRGSWQPHNDATLWVKFNLRAHHMQAQTMRRRFHEAETQWRKIDELLAAHKLNERVEVALFDALLGRGSRGRRASSSPSSTSAPRPGTSSTPPSSECSRLAASAGGVTTSPANHCGKSRRS